MKVHLLTVGSIGTNCYILEKNGETIIIDPGGDEEKIKEFITIRNLKPQAILLTHAHFDHIGALDAIRNHFQIDVYLNEREHSWLSDPSWNGSRFLSEPVVMNDAEHSLKEGFLEIGSFKMEVKHTPGHSPGSMSFIFHDDKIIFGGDVLFFEGIGRTDLPGGSFQQITETIRNIFYLFPEQYVVFPGHGPQTTIQHEKQHNPFIPE